MNKFPMLGFYKNAAYILGSLTLLGGFIIAIQAANNTFYAGFQFGTFLTSFIAFALAAGSLFVLAEFISLALRIEDHLDLMRQNDERFHSALNKNLNNSLTEIASTLSKLSARAVGNASQSAAAEKAAPVAQATAPASEPPETVAVQPGIQLDATVIPERAILRRTPTAKGAVYRAFKQGTVVVLAGRNADSQWVECIAGGWAAISDLEIAGDVQSLPISTTTW